VSQKLLAQGGGYQSTAVSRLTPERSRAPLDSRGRVSGVKVFDTIGSFPRGKHECPSANKNK
jgi:hypothetical protein